MKKKKVIAGFFVVLCVSMFSACGNMNSKAGNIIKFGSYEQDNDLSNGAEPIEWQVIGTKDGQTLLLSKYVLDCKKFLNSQTYTSWENCTLRSWLNNDFYNTAFSDADKERIVTAHNENPDSYGVFKASGSDSYLWGEAGNATDDKVFLLSITEVSEYFDGKAYDNDLGADNFNQKLICKPTAYAKAQGVKPYTNDKNYYPSDTVGCCYWWLRSPGISNATAAVVDYYGSLACDQVYFTLYSVGVRPAILVQQSPSATGTSSSATSEQKSSSATSAISSEPQNIPEGSFEWPKNSKMANLVPKPDTQVCDVLIDGENSFVFNAYGYSKEGYLAYVKACRSKGFTLDDGDNGASGWYLAKDKKGNSLSVKYRKSDEAINVRIDGP